MNIKYTFLTWLKQMFQWKLLQYTETLDTIKGLLIFIIFVFGNK